MNIIIFNYQLSGHHIEFLHHEYMMAIASPENQYVFVLPQSFEEVKNKLVWPTASNISFDLFHDEEVEQWNVIPTKSLSKSWNLNKILKRYVVKHKADTVLNNNLVTLLPFAAFMLPQKLKLCGILYHIYLYNLDGMSWHSRKLNEIKYKLLSKAKVFHRVFVLNDEASASQFNQIYKTQKFVPLPDPFTPIPEGEDINIRELLSIADDKKVFIHFGAMARRKGTLKILDSLKLLSDDECSKYAFIFAGRIAQDIIEEFYDKLQAAKDKVQVIVKDEFCSYEFLGALCNECDAILCPYLDTSLSSGLIGYAAQFKKPVIAPDKGLIGKLVKKYEMGALISSVTPENLKESYSKVLLLPNNDLNAYCEANNVSTFISTLKKIWYER